MDLVDVNLKVLVLAHPKARVLLSRDKSDQGSRLPSAQRFINDNALLAPYYD
jgi:hypothetical protein